MHFLVCQAFIWACRCVFNWDPSQVRSSIWPNTGPASVKMLPKIGYQYIVPLLEYNFGMHLAVNSGSNSGRQHLFSVKVPIGLIQGQYWLSFGWRLVNLNSRQRPPSSAQHLTNANGDTGPITIADCWLPRLSQYCAVLSASEIRTWDLWLVKFYI